ncbi:hypothetical protein GQ457_15G018880 [Hibiscus cannabinus]
MGKEEEDFKLQIEAFSVKIKFHLKQTVTDFELSIKRYEFLSDGRSENSIAFRCFGSGNSLWTFVGSDALARVIHYGLLFRCFGSGNSLWTFVGSDASARVIPYGLLQVPMLWLGFRCFGSGNPLWATVGSDASARVIPYGLLFRFFGSSDSLWSSVGSDVSVRVIPDGPI